MESVSCFRMQIAAWQGEGLETVLQGLDNGIFIRERAKAFGFGSEGSGGGDVLTATLESLFSSQA